MLFNCNTIVDSGTSPAKSMAPESREGPTRWHGHGWAADERRDARGDDARRHQQHGHLTHHHLGRGAHHPCKRRRAALLTSFFSLAVVSDLLADNLQAESVWGIGMAQEEAAGKLWPILLYGRSHAGCLGRSNGALEHRSAGARQLRLKVASSTNERARR